MLSDQQVVVVMIWLALLFPLSSLCFSTTSFIHTCLSSLPLCLFSSTILCCCQSFAPCTVRRIFIVYKRNICGAEHCPWGGTVCDGYLDHTRRGLLTKEPLYLVALHCLTFLCLDMNGKERNQLVVNTRASMPCPSSCSPHSHLCFLPRLYSDRLFGVV